MKFIKIISLFIILLVLFIVSISIFTISEREYAVVTQFGKPVRILKEAGLYFKLPGLMQKVNRLDKRTDIFKTQPIPLFNVSSSL